MRLRTGCRGRSGGSVVYEDVLIAGTCQSKADGVTDPPVELFHVSTSLKHAVTTLIVFMSHSSGTTIVVRVRQASR